MSISSYKFLIWGCLFGLLLQLADAKRGCNNFGHSCYGGLGKRTQHHDNAIGLNDEVVVDANLQDDEENPALVFTGPRSVFPPRPPTYDISPFLKQWLRSIQRNNSPLDGTPARSFNE